MRAVSPELDSPKVRVGSRPGSRSERLRKSRLRNVALEWLESRQLLAALPTPTVTAQVNVSNSNGTSNDSSPSIAIDPTNPQHMVSVWTHFDTSQQGNPPNPQTYVEGAYSTNGGTTWNAMGKVSATIGDFTSTATPQPVFAQGSDASVSFDRSGNFYILSSQHTADSSAGELLLEKYNLSAGGALTQSVNNQRVYVWNGDGVLKPTMAVDNNLASFSDGGGTTQTDPTAGNMYIAWESNDATPPNTGNWNPNTIRMIVSSDGGQTFSGITTLSNGGNFGTEREGAPRLTISQGGPGVTGGQVTVVWDDFGSLATSSPTPLDGIDVDRITATTQQFSGAGQAYGPAVTVNNVVIPTITTIPIQVTPTSNFNITDLSVRLAIAQADVQNVSVTLTSPGGGITIPLIAATAITGNGFGTLTPTLLDSNAPRALAQGAAPYTGTFKPSGNLGAFAGQSSASLSGSWTLTLTNISTANGGSINTAAVVLTGLTASGQATVAEVDVRGAVGNSYGTGSAADPFGIGPDPSLASDNTVGSFSQFQGRIYLTYVDRFDSNVTTFSGNPADNTDIFMIASDNGGVSWIVPSTGAAFAAGSRGYTGELINNDNADTDGYSEAVTGTEGRAQFQPSIAVDPGTGAVVISYYDGRYDAARARVAMTVAASIDGGATFSQTYANATLVVLNQATGADVTNTPGQLAVNPILPILDNDSSGSNADRTVFGFGDHQGIAVMNGKIYPVWSSNQNGGTNGKELLDIWTAPTEIPVGPRIISGSQGPIGLNSSDSELDVNNETTTNDGTPIVSKFVVTFDRPVNPNSFGIASVVVHYRDVNGNVTNIAPLTVVPQNTTTDGATVFTITFTPQSAVGTYSYEILGTTITDRIPTSPPTSGVISGSKMDQNGNATAGQATDFFAVPTPTGNSPFAAPFVQTTLPLIVPGPHVIKSFSTATGYVTGSADNEILNGTINSLDVTFDRNMDPSTISGADVLRIQGPAGLVAGPFTMVPDPQAGENASFPRTFKIGFPTQFLSGTYTITLASTIKSESGVALDTNLNAGVDVLKGTSTNTPIPLTVSSNDTPVVIQPGQTVSSQITLNSNFLIQGLTLQMNIAYGNDPDLTATLVAPDGTSIVLFSNLPPSGGTANFNNTIFDDTASTAITDGNAPYAGRFRPANPLSVLDGSSSVTGPGGTGTGVYTLQITNAGTLSGSLSGWSMTLLQPNSSTGVGEPVADRAQVSFRIFTMDPTNPLSNETWTSVGPASISGSNSGRVGGIAVDPSDPSGNTVYVAGASGGVWKTNDFLTTNANGPTWIPLTDFGAALGVNTGGIAVFGRNNDPNQSIIFVATGEGDTGSAGVGFLRSMDGGATWTLLDSTDNTLPYASRDHEFVGTTSFDIMVDPNPTPSGNVVVYAALGGAHGGLWRSTDSGATWGVINPTTGLRVPNLAIQDSGGNTLPVTSMAFESNSGTPSVNNPSGNLQVLYAAVEGSGVYISPNQGQVWSLMAGGVGDPLIHDATSKNPIPVNQPAGATPNGANGRIVLVAPQLLPSSVANASLQNFIYQNWLYALVVTPTGNLQGLYVTKDQGQNWTQVRIATLPTAGGPGVTSRLVIPTNNTAQADYNFLGGLGGFAAQGNYDVSLGIDPVNPNIVYLGGTLDGNNSGFLRVDITGLNDPHALYQSDTLNDNGMLTVNSAGAVSLATPANGISHAPTINLIRNPASPLSGTATFTVGSNMGTFQNSGAGATWIPFDGATGFTDQHRMVTIIDPLTGHSRIITGDDQGIFSAVDNNGTIDSGIGSASLPGNSRNGNLQITQFYYGAVQPSSAAAQVKGALIYGSAQDDGTPNSGANVLTNGNIFWSGPTGDATGVATDQTGGLVNGVLNPTLYQYHWPCCGGNGTDFFQVNGVGRTNGLLQVSNPGTVPDPQWPNVAGFNFAVNPINGNQIIMGSAAGRLFRTEDEGQDWLVIANPAILDGSTIPALAFGAPDPVTGGGSLDNFIYAGTAGGHMFVTFSGGGATGNSWFNITQGLDGSSINAIVTDPNRGTYDAYAVTSRGVYYMPNALAAATNPNVVWQNITSNLFNLKNDPFGDPTLSQQWILSLSSIQADWRYLIPDNPSQPSGPSHPVLYVGGQGGVFYSLNKGASWQPFPNQVSNSVPTTLPFANNTNNGYFNGLPLSAVSDLDMSIGVVDPTTGHSVIASGDPNVLIATTYGTGDFAVRLAPFVMPNTTANGVNPDYITLDPSVNPRTSTIGQEITDVTPVIDGTSEQSAFGNTVTVKLYDLTAGTTNPIPIPLTGTITTDGNGHFKITVAPGYFVTPGIYTVGIQATDQTGASGNMAEFTFVFDPPPPPPTAIVLDSTTDSGTFQNDQYTNFNNSAVAPAASNAPLFDVSGIVTPPSTGNTTVVLLRASEVNGVVGTFSVVNQQSYTSADLTGAVGSLGTIQIADTNGGAGTILDTPLNTQIDTAPNQPNQYVYEAYQIDFLNSAGSNYTGPLGVIVDTTAPAAPTSVTLDHSSDSGTSNGDSYTNANNSNNNAPIFDVSGIEPHATVELIRTDINGNQTIANIIQNMMPTGPNNTVQIADINGNNTKIPDSPVGAPPDTAPPSGSPYSYSAIQIDLAGNPSGQSKPSFGNKGAIVLDGTDADNHGSFTGGANQNGWLYMQKVLNAIDPNITNGNKVLVALGVNPATGGGGGGGGGSSATQAILSAFTQSILPSQGWTLVYVSGAANMTSYLNGQPAAAVTSTNASAGTVTIGQTGFMYITTFGHASGDLTAAELQVIDNSGLDILSYVNGGGGLYTQTETQAFGFGGGGGNAPPPSYGWLSSLFPTIQVISVNSENPVNIQLTAAGQATFPGLTNADLSGGPWHNYFSGTIPASLAAMFTDTNPTDKTHPTDTVILGLSSVGTVSTAPTTGDQVIIDTTPPVQSNISLDASTDSGSLNNDQITNANNANNNPPLFDVTGVEPNGILKLYRVPVNPSTDLPTGAPVLVNTTTEPSNATIQGGSITDTNAGQGRIADGTYLYYITQTDLAGNVSLQSLGSPNNDTATGGPGLIVIVSAAPPSAPTAIVLDPTTDSGTFNGDQYTNFNNSTSNPPIYDVSGIAVPPTTPNGETTTVFLLRASEVGGVIGAYTVVAQQTYTNAAQFSNIAGGFGTVQITDTNGGNGTIPDTPVNTLIDTAPNQPNQYVYQAYQVNYIGNKSGTYSAPNGVIVDTTDPSAPTSVTLDPASDSGTSNGDSYTNAVNAPIFDVSGIEPHATVELIRTDSKGNQTIVNIVQNVTPTGPKNTVQIADINANNTPVPESPVGSPPDTAPPSGNPYTYTAIQIDLAGNPSGASKPTFGNKGAIVLDGTDADNHGDFSGTVNEQGWLYMQKVLDAIQPNITSSAKVLVALGADPNEFDGGDPNFLFGATGAIYSAFTESTLPGLGWKLEYVTGNTNIDNFLSGQSVPALNNLGAASGTVSIAQTGFLYITTFDHTGDDLTNAELQTIDNHGLDILSYVNTGGGLYTQAESPVSLFGGGFPTSYGWLSSLFPGITAVGAGSESPINIQLTAAGQSIFPGLTNADLSGGPWHNYFSGTIPSSLTALFTDTNPNDRFNNADTVILGLSSVGSVNTAVTGDQVIYDVTPPAQSTVSLDASSDSGTFNNDQITNDNNANGNSPLFDVTGVEPNAILKLFRVSGTLVNGVFTPTGSPGLVNTVTEPSNATIQGGSISDINGGNGAIPDGYYLYYITQTDLAGNVSVQSLGSPNFSTSDGPGVVVLIDATAPAAPRPFQLDPASDTGTFNNDNYTKDNNGNPYPAPTFDLFGVEPNATVELFRALVVNGIPTGSILVNTLTDVTPTGGNSLVQVPDINGGNGVIPDGVYAYTAKQIDLAGNVGPSSNTVTVTINTAVPNPSPLPAPDLEAGSDTGISNIDNITQDDNGLFPAPIFDVGTVVQPVDRAATVQLWRAPVVNGVIGTPILVNTLTNVAGGDIPIADNNAGNGQIADGTYDYYARLISLSGVPSNGITVGGVSGLSTALTVVIDATTPALANSLRLDASSDTGVSNSDGITRITISQHPLFDVTGILSNATVNLYRAPVTNGVIGAATLVNTLNNAAPTGLNKLVKIADPTVIPDGQYVYTVQQIDDAGNIGPIGVATIAPTYPNDIIYDTVQPAIPTKPVLDPASDTGAKGDNSTSNTSPFIDVAVSVPGFEQNAQLTLVRDGSVVATTAYNVTSSPVEIQDPGPVPFGTHVYQAYLTDLAGNISPLSPGVTITFANDAPGSLTLESGSDSGVKGDDITNVTKPTFDVASVATNSTLRLLRNGLVVATVPTGAGGTVSITDPGPLASGVYSYTSQVVDSKGNASPTGPALTVTIDLTIPGAPSGFVLDPNSDSGLKGDNLTNINDPTFDASGVVAGATVNLYRNGALVASLVSTKAGAITINDPGPVPDGTYTYLVQQVSVAGNVSPNSVQAIVTIQTATPATPALVLDPASDSGNKGDNTTNVTSPFFDASGVVSGSTLKLYRNGLNVKTLTNVVLNANGLVLIQDPGPLSNGSYSYTAQQTTLAGNTSVIGAPLTITINTAPPVTPTTPVLTLDVSTDTGLKGDDITSSRQPKLDGTTDPAIVVTLLDGRGNVLGTTTSDSLGNFSFSIAQSLTDGSYGYQAYATNTLGTKSPTSPLLTINVITVAGDYNGSGQDEVSVFRRTNPNLAQWFAANTIGMATGLSFGSGSLDVPVVGDFTGTGKDDPTVYRSSTATWYMAAPPTYATLTPVTFGWANHDVPVPADYNGAGITQIAVYRPTTGQWFVQGIASPFAAVVSPALTTDIPVPANYDNTGKDEFAVYRPTTGTWYVNGPSGVYNVSFDPGGAGGIPVPGAYDASVTSHAAELSIFNPTTGQWFIKTTTGTRMLQFNPGDVPVPGDYEGTGITEPVVYRPSTGQWFVESLTDTVPRLLASFGQVGKDIPVVSPYRYRALGGGVNAGTNGTITAASIPSLDLAASAAALSSTIAPATATTFNKAATPTPPAATVSTIRVRPAQASQVVVESGQGTGHLVDQALASLVKVRATRKGSK